MVRPRTFKLSCYKNGSMSKFTMGNMASVMCPKCYCIKDLKQFGMCGASVVGEDNVDLIISPRYHLECNECGFIGTWISLDYAISRIVRAFNVNGYKTELACSGHDDESDDTATIKFERHHDFVNLPAGWCVDGLFIKCSKPSDESFKDLLEYASSISKLY